MNVNGFKGLLKNKRWMDCVIDDTKAVKSVVMGDRDKWKRNMFYIASNTNNAK